VSSVDGGVRGEHVQALPETFVVLLITHVRGCCDEVVDACLGPDLSCAFARTRKTHRRQWASVRRWETDTVCQVSDVQVHLSRPPR
jgi:hypothetical protein